MTLSEYINAPINQALLRTEMEMASVANQMAVIGYLKFNKMEKYLARELDREQYFAVMDVVRKSRIDLLSDLNMKSIDAALDYVLYTLDW